MLDININYQNEIGIIDLKGELDAKTAPELTAFFNSQLADNKVNFVFDLKELEYSSSAGIRIFLGSARETRKNGGDIRIAEVSPQVGKIFSLSKFDKIVKIFETVDQAVESFK